MFTLELLSGIWIADSNILNSKKFMDDNQITIILNCTQIFDFPDISTIQKIRLPFSNNKNSDTDLSLIRENKTNYELDKLTWCEPPAHVDSPYVSYHQR